MKKSLLNLYCTNHPEFLESLEIFSESNKNKILKNLKAQNCISNFLSIVAEVKFGKLFTELSFAIEYEKKYTNNQTPDWSLFSKNLNTICEVYRLGKSQRDQIYSDLESEIIEALKKLEYNYFIKIRRFEKGLDTVNFNTSQIITQVTEWLSKSAKETGDKIIVNTNLEFEIIKTNTNINHLCFIGPVKSIDYKPYKLKQHNSQRDNEITKKLKKYNEIILNKKFGFIICIAIDGESGFNVVDFIKYFFGSKVENMDYGNQDLEEWGSTWTGLGEFYTNPQLSGVLILYNNSFTFLINPNRSQLIHNKENNLFKETLLHLNTADAK